MSSFTLTNRAKTDLKEIVAYTKERWGRNQRDEYLTMLDACFHQLAANPLKGTDCGDIRNGYRKLFAGRHVIYYRQMLNDSIEIVRILHRRMDIETQLSGS
jgi:toxin ParE1/3/4